MGLSSVFSTAISGLQAAESTIDITGNNVANSGTIGFKSSQVVFATQFLQTLGLGSSPSGNSGGTNPRQIGLGVQVAGTSLNFTQGTVQISTNASDLAIQNEGFFIVRSTSGEQLYTRNGQFQINAENQLTTIGGERLLGFGVDDNFEIQSTQLVPLQIPLGSAAVAKATQVVTMEGTLTPTGDVANVPENLLSSILSDGSQSFPTVGPNTSALSQTPLAGSSAIAVGVGNIEAGQYQWKYVFVDAQGNETVPSSATTPPLTLAGSQNVDITGMLTATQAGLNSAVYTQKRLYRIDLGAANPVYQLVPTGPIAESATSVTDSTTQAALNAVIPPLSNDMMGVLGNGSYQYYVTWRNPGTGEESRPTPVATQSVAAGGRIRLDIPAALQPNPLDPGGYSEIRIYRSTAGSTTAHYLVAQIPGTQTAYIDGTPDAVITNTDATVNPFQAATVDLNGPSITAGLALVNVRKLENGVYIAPFQPGTLSFTPRKGGRTLETKSLQITNTTTVQDLMDFMKEASGVQSIAGNEGGTVANSRLNFIGNFGVDNSLEFGPSSLQIVPTAGGLVQQINLGFASTQAAKGQSAVADFLAYDSLGIPVNVRVTTILESRTGSTTTYRWFADSSNNDPSQVDPIMASRIAVGTGLITFDGEGKFLAASNSTVAVDRVNIPSSSPLTFDLDFTGLSGLAATTPTLAATRQDGFPPGKLSSYIISEDGVIRGVFDNGTQRELGQIRLARFANPQGLEQRGKNLYASAVNSGLPIVGNPASQGIATIVSGAVELSNTDIGKSLITLITASTQYRGNARVITAAEQLLEELLNLRR